MGKGYTVSFKCTQPPDNIDIVSINERVTQLILQERNPELLHRVIQLLDNDKRSDKRAEVKISRLAGAGGNVGEFFKYLHLCKIYSLPVINDILNKDERNNSAIYIIMSRAEQRLAGKDTDMVNNNRINKVRLVLKRLYDKGKLPFTDVNSIPIPVFTHSCIINNPTEKIIKMIMEEYA